MKLRSHWPKLTRVSATIDCMALLSRAWPNSHLTTEYRRNPIDVETLLSRTVYFIRAEKILAQASCSFDWVFGLGEITICEKLCV